MVDADEVAEIPRTRRVGEERRQAITDLLVTTRAVDPDDPADRFSISKTRIHLDLDDLQQAGSLCKDRGEATVESSIQFESDFRVRAVQDAAAQSCLLVSHKRFGRSVLHVLADLTGLDAIIADAATAPEDRAAVNRAGISLTVARTGP
jgi:DeoR/GlpR family transcriptional regulator of sugar metabolism